MIPNAAERPGVLRFAVPNSVPGTPAHIETINLKKIRKGGEAP